MHVKMKNSKLYTRIKTFVFSLHFANGLRITFGVLLPAVVLAQIGQLALGVTISLGAYCISIADSPGPFRHKRNAMLCANLFIFLVAIFTGLINKSPILISIEIALLCFVGSMFSVYGTRASYVGIVVLVVMILTIDYKLTPIETLKYACGLLAGGIWYMVFSLLVFRVKSYRLAQQTLGECLEQITAYLRLKARLYDIQSDYDECYKKLVATQIIIHQRQDAVRELLFQSDTIAKRPSKMVRLLIIVFIDLIDLFEQTMAAPYDYHTIRNQYRKTGVLDLFQKVINKLADELENIAYCSIQDTAPTPLYDFQPNLEALEKSIDLVEEKFGIDNLILKNRLKNIRGMSDRLQKIYSHYSKEAITIDLIQSDLYRFVSHQYFDLRSLKNNLNLESAAFRYSLRMTIACLVGYTISNFFPFGHHSYWILLTIVIILRSDFKLTKQRNYQRLMGTIIGGIAGACLLIYMENPTVLFLTLLFCMIMSFSFQNLSYIVSVAFLTPYILIVFSFLGENNFHIAEERIIDTLIGSTIALVASYFILPSWQYDRLKDFLKKALLANYNYLLKVDNNLYRKPWDIIAYKLVRKDVYVSAANIGDAFQRMLAEPKSKQHKMEELNQFVVLNHMLSSYISTLIHSTHKIAPKAIQPDHIALVKESLFGLGTLIHRVDPSYEVRFEEIESDRLDKPKKEIIHETHESKILTEQLKLVGKVVKDLDNINERLYI